MTDFPWRVRGSQTNLASAGQIDLADAQGTTYQSQNPLFAWANLADFFATDYRLWVPANILAPGNVPPGSAAGDVADALGSTTNPNVMFNLDRNLNVSDVLNFITLTV